MTRSFIASPVPSWFRMFCLAAAVCSLPAIGNATLVETDQSSFNLVNSETAFDANISGSDLINNGNPLRTGVSTSGTAAGGGFPALTDGLAAASTIANDAYFSHGNGSFTLANPEIATYTLDTAAHPLGYNITSINTFNGWQDSNGYSNQSYMVEVAHVGSPVFSLLATVTYSPFNPGLLGTATGANSSEVSLTDTTGILATGVDQIRFTWLYTNTTLSPDGQNVREADVFGAPVPVPEPAGVSLLAFGLVAVAFVWNRQRRKQEGSFCCQIIRNPVFAESRNTPRFRILAILVTMVMLLSSASASAAAVEALNLTAGAGVLKTGGTPAANGDGVATWKDQTANNYNAVQATGANQPTLVTGALNGQPVVHFTGTALAGDWMNVAVSPQINQQFTVFLVGDIQGNAPAPTLAQPQGATDFFFDSASGSNRVLLAINPSGANENQLATYAGGSNVIAVTETRATWQQYHIYEAVFNGSSSQIYIDGTLVGSGSGTIPGSGPIQDLLLGERLSNTNFLNGDIATLQVWQGALTPEQENGIGQGLQSTFGLTGAYVPEPASWLMISIGAVALVGYGRRRRCSPNAQGN